MADKTVENKNVIINQEEPPVMTPTMLGNLVQYVRNSFDRLFATTDNTSNCVIKKINSECGYKQTIQEQDYWDMFLRTGMGGRCVEALPKESFKVFPEIIEEEGSKQTPWETAVEQLVIEQNLWNILLRVDILSGILRYGGLLIGVDDKQPLDQPFVYKAGAKITYLRPLCESQARILQVETDPTNERFGKPLYYTVSFLNPNSSPTGTTTNSLDPYVSLSSLKVHHSRFVHHADNVLDSDQFGVPRLHQIFDHLQDLKKLLGGSTEMYWKGGFPGISFETQPGLLNDGGGINIDKESLRREVYAYSSGLQRYLSLEGMTAKSLSPQVEDPSNQVMTCLTIIAAKLGIPLQKLIGTESGHLANSQDTKTDNARVVQRENMVVSPLIRNVLDRFVDMGILPKPGNPNYRINWPDPNAMTDADKADVALKTTQTFMQYLSSDAARICPPEEFFSIVMGWNPDLVELMIASMGKYNAKPTIPAPIAAIGANSSQSGGKEGNPNQNTNGRPVGSFGG